MTELNAKQEAIKNAWGDLYEKCKKSLTENGWLKVDYSLYQGVNSLEYDLLSNEVEIDLIDRFIRPKSLQGIENNNGWIKIESEADLPNENTWCFIISKIAGITHGEFLIKNKDFWLTDATHYQPIEKPKLPIY